MIEYARRISQWGILLETVGRVWLCSRFPAGTGNLNELKNYNGVTKFAKMERSVWSIIIYVYEIIVCINNVISRVQRISASKERVACRCSSVGRAVYQRSTVQNHCESTLCKCFLLLEKFSLF